MRISAEARELFTLFVEDARNWSGMPMVGGNFDFTKADCGHLTALKKAHLVATTDSDGEVFVTFTSKGAAYARHLCLDATDLYVENSVPEDVLTADGEGELSRLTYTRR